MKFVNFHGTYVDKVTHPFPWRPQRKVRPLLEKFPHDSEFMHVANRAEFETRKAARPRCSELWLRSTGLKISLLVKVRPLHQTLEDSSSVVSKHILQANTILQHTCAKLKPQKFIKLLHKSVVLEIFEISFLTFL